MKLKNKITFHIFNWKNKNSFFVKAKNIEGLIKKLNLSLSFEDVDQYDLQQGFYNLYKYGFADLGDYQIKACDDFENKKAWNKFKTDIANWVCMWRYARQLISIGKQDKDFILIGAKNEK